MNLYRGNVFSFFIFLAATVLALAGCSTRAEKDAGSRVRHIILWTLSDELSGQQKAAILDDLYDTVQDMEKTIPGAVSFNMLYKDKLASSNCDFMFDFTFEDQAALEAFATNPDHLAASAAIKPYITGRTCLDVPAGR